MRHVEYIIRKHLFGGGLTALYQYYRQRNYYCTFRLYRVLFSTKQLLATGSSYCWLYPSKQAVDHFMLFAHLYSLPPGMLSHASSGSGTLCPYRWCWQIIDHDKYE